MIPPPYPTPVPRTKCRALCLRDLCFTTRLSPQARMGVVILPRLPVLCLPARGCDFIIWIFPSFACSGLVQLPRVRCFLKRVVPCSGVLQLVSRVCLVLNLFRVGGYSCPFSTWAVFLFSFKCGSSLAFPFSFALLRLLNWLFVLSFLKVATFPQVLIS